MAQIGLVTEITADKVRLEHAQLIGAVAVVAVRVDQVMPVELEPINQAMVARVRVLIFQVH